MIEIGGEDTKRRTTPRRIGMLDDLKKDKRSYVGLKRMAEERDVYGGVGTRDLPWPYRADYRIYTCMISKTKAKQIIRPATATILRYC